MPELPEVEASRRAMERVLRGRRIVSVRVARDPIVCEKTPAGRFVAALEGARVEEIRRKGKHLFIALDRRPWVLLHLGMSGRILTGPSPRELRPALTLRRAATGAAERYEKLALGVEDGGALVFADPRRLGRLRLRANPLEEPPLSDLGDDAFDELPSPGELARRLATRRRPLKALLLDQGFMAGIGNWIADEVIYHARLDPRVVAATLAPNEVRRLHGAIHRVLTRAVAVDADSARFPRTWLFHHRWGRKEGARTARGERIEFLEVGGRTTAFVPERADGGERR